MRRVVGSIGRRWREVLPARLGRPLAFAGIAALTVAAAAFGTIFPPSPAGDALPIPRAPAKGAVVRQLPRGRVLPILGKEVRSVTSGNIGRVVGLLVDEAGRPRAAILDIGGFLGVGTRRVAIDWRALSFFMAGKRAVLFAALEPRQLQGAPPYKAAGKTIAVIGPSRATGRGLDPRATPR